MNLKRKILMGVAALALPLGTGAFVVGTPGSAFAGAPANDTVSCGSFIGTITINPFLTLGGTTPTKIKVKGTLEGCTDGLSAVNAGGAFTGSVIGTLYGTSNDLTGLAGANPLTCKHGNNWKANPTHVPPIAPVHCDTTGLDGNPFGSLSVAWSNGDSTTLMPLCTFGEQLTLNGAADATSQHPFSDAEHTGSVDYGAFVLGAESNALLDSNGHSCSSSAIYTAAGQQDNSAQSYIDTGAFSGGDGFVNASTVAMTANDAVALANGQSNKGANSVITLGSATTFLG